jgi:hypothetical protein
LTFTPRLGSKATNHGRAFYNQDRQKLINDLKNEEARVLEHYNENRALFASCTTIEAVALPKAIS